MPTSEHEIGCLPSKVDAETPQDESESCTCLQPAFDPPMESLEGGAEGIPKHPSERVGLTSSEASSSCS